MSTQRLSSRQVRSRERVGVERRERCLLRGPEHGVRPGRVHGEAAAHVARDSLALVAARHVAHPTTPHAFPDELANMPPPEGPLMKLMLALPQPILPGLTELPCIQ